MTDRVVVSDIDFEYPTIESSRSVEIFRGLSLAVPDGAITAIVGPSGCGKSTLLNLIAGVLRPTRGSIEFASASTPNRVAYVFQSPTLVPWRSVRWNALFGAHAAGLNDNETELACDRLLERFLLTPFADQFPSVLSGGMQQRVSIVRAILSRASVLLLDEPFSSSDYFMRLDLQQEIGRIIEEHNLATVLVTHDVEDCLRIADRILFLTDRPARILGHVAIEVPRSERITDIGLKQIEAARRAAWRFMRMYRVDAQG